MSNAMLWPVKNYKVVEAGNMRIQIVAHGCFLPPFYGEFWSHPYKKGWKLKLGTQATCKIW